MRSARSVVMFSGLTVNSIRLEKSAANSPEKFMSTISTLGRPSRFAISLIMSTPKPSGPLAPRTIHGAIPKSDPTTSALPGGWSASCDSDRSGAKTDITEKSAAAAPKTLRRAFMLVSPVRSSSDGPPAASISLFARADDVSTNGGQYRSGGTPIRRVGLRCSRETAPDRQRGRGGR